LPDRISHRLLLLLAILIFAGCGPHVRLMPGDEVQTLLIQQAQEHFAEGRYETSARILRRLVEMYPQSPKQAEARWWLARSYERAGLFKAALAEYRLLVSLPPGQPPQVNYGPEANTHIAALEQRLGILATTAHGLVGLQVVSRSVPDAIAIDQWMQGLKQAGITMLVLDAGTKPGAAREASPAGAYFKTSWATTVRDVFGYAVPAAHRQGLAVFAAVSLRQMNWLDRQLGWNDAMVDRTTGRLAVSSELDLFHPAFQEYLIGFLADLAATGIDGLLIRADAPSGPQEGFSYYGLRGFERDFAVKLDPATLVFPATAATSRVAPVRNGQPVRQEGTQDYWRWLGWKARETLTVMDRLRHAVRQRAPVLQFALELHREAVSDPVRALLHYGEDLLEAKTVRFDFYVTADGPAPAPFVTVPPPNSVPALVRPSGTFASRAVELLGEADDIWLAKPLPAGDAARPWARMAPDADRASLATGLGLVYLESPLEVP
jgi:tetratricopeptide (TPR) repeat protein